MSERITDFGTVRIGSAEELFTGAVRIAMEARRAVHDEPFTWALTGGSTPKAWYRWCVAQQALAETWAAGVYWFVSDERYVPLADPESNFGNAERLLLDPLGVPAAQRHPWNVALPPNESAREIAEKVGGLGGGKQTFSLCFLGLGDDAHTASLFPGSALLREDVPDRFAAVAVPGKGWRLTITPAGLRACNQIVVTAIGAAKAAAVRRIFLGSEPVLDVPAKILRENAARVTWFLDEAAGAAFGH